MFMKIILALSLAAFTLAVPVTQPQVCSSNPTLAEFCLSIAATGLSATNDEVAFLYIIYLEYCAVIVGLPPPYL
ncbi:hypothetical protein EDB92DRAFT_1944937 [Lactarius akahatsu]|uniref:Uncharacterized protein n=1 Tax=Lactarius akahatsu TaxID=416441 RepID=A0AAD4QE96_9AGAM|nr:hypothetical protein EDB92DRAFT_1944937 [Lactarius akahatsu]